MILREQYLAKLRMFREKDVIKVVTGIRRCGKSTLLEQFREELIREGVGEDRIIYINFEDLAYENLLDYHAMYDYITARLSDSGYTYIFLDEVQRVPEFQKAVDSLYIKKNTDVYPTCCRANLRRCLPDAISKSACSPSLSKNMFRRFPALTKRNCSAII